ncbi:MAG: beta-propeller fold lactonase family protein [Candidatus Eremiobacteraeota bacterium]|nr:beta-propeller fold lactonase family protein [Candidatus Eremiobacteraeota bacterium]
MKRLWILAVCAALAGAAGVAATGTHLTLPSGWRLSAPAGPVATTGTMPQGLALSPNGRVLAVVESGFNPAALRLMNPDDFSSARIFPMPGAFGTPYWLSDDDVLLPGANADAILDVKAADGSFDKYAMHKGSYPVAIAMHDGNTQMATANDGDGSVSLFDSPQYAEAKHIAVGARPADLRYSPDGNHLYVAVRGTSYVAYVDLASENVTQLQVGLHPNALAMTDDKKTLYVSLSDDDAVAEIDTASNTIRRKIDVGLHEGRTSGEGASPNALLVRGDTLYVSLGAQNAVAVVRGGRVVERIPAGWYPTGIAATPSTLFVLDGKGEGTHPNLDFDPEGHMNRANEYVAATIVGSLRAVSLTRVHNQSASTQDAVANMSPLWSAPAQTVVRTNGPIKHVIYVIKENRSYDQVLGDVPHANGRASLAMFGERVTPNQHAIVARFGVLDNAYTNSQVSADGHNWTDAAFANDYLERFWPSNYGRRRELYDFEYREGAQSPHNGYLWDSAVRDRVTFRDYGEQLLSGPAGTSVTGFRNLQGRFDPHSIGWDLNTSDETRVVSWRREFDDFVRNKNLPQFEILYLPNDHTSATKPGAPTPQAYVAINDHALGEVVDAVSHSPYWNSTAVFSVEDDAQNGPDHVSNQRSTFYIASPYAKAGVHHHHYSTASVVHTVEVILGLKPLSIYDATAEPLYDAFSATADMRPFNVIAPKVDVRARNAQTAYGARISARLDFTHPDAVDPKLMTDLILHSQR